MASVSVWTARSAILAGRHIILKGVQNNRRFFAAMSEALDKVPEVDIDPHGRFKYILIRVSDEKTKAEKMIVRGYARAGYHSDIFDITSGQLEKIGGLRAKCPGGGRIEHDPDEKTIKVYGYSQGYGKADHALSVDLLKKKYPDYNITWSDEGY